MNNFIFKFKNGSYGYFRNFILGQTYILNNGIIVKFIKVTPKGYNLLDIKTNKCFLRYHLYSKDLAFKEIPEDTTILKNVRVPECITLKEIDITKIGI